MNYYFGIHDPWHLNSVRICNVYVGDLKRKKTKIQLWLVIDKIFILGCACVVVVWRVRSFMRCAVCWTNNENVWSTLFAAIRAMQLTQTQQFWASYKWQWCIREAMQREFNQITAWKCMITMQTHWMESTRMSLDMSFNSGLYVNHSKNWSTDVQYDEVCGAAKRSLRCGHKLA